MSVPAATRPPVLSVVIPVRNDASRLQRCLASLMTSAGNVPVEWLVVDNGSTDSSQEVAIRAGATVLALPGVTVAAARNAAAARATAPLLAFVDADHLVDANWITSALDVLANRSIAAAGAPYASPLDANWIQRAYGRFRPVVAGQQESDWLGSGNLVIRRETFAAIGGFDATLEACEDVDLCNRLRRSRHQLVADSRLHSIHLGDPRTLKALFFGELWRGRNNIRVTLRGPLGLRELPSVLIPVIDLTCIAAICVAPWTGLRTVLGSALVIAALVGLRAVRMTRRRPHSSAITQVIQNVAVAAVYDLARALALVARATHRTRRERTGEHAVA